MNNIADLFQQADGIVILAGAGMSVDSGLPDFRGTTGMWTTAQENFVKMATARGFDEHPVIAWNFYISRILAYQNVKPHRGYQALLQCLMDRKKDYFVVTSNVDGHFQKAGYDAARVHEIHGDLRHAQCKNMCSHQLYPMPQFANTVNHVDEIAKCPRCNSILRPHVLMFSDPAFIWTNVDAGADRYREWSATKLNVVGIEIGAGRAIPSIRQFGESRTSALIRINLYESEPVRPWDMGIPATAVDGIDILINSLP